MMTTAVVLCVAVDVSWRTHATSAERAVQASDVQVRDWNCIGGCCEGKQCSISNICKKACVSDDYDDKCKGCKCDGGDTWYVTAQR